MGDLFDYTKESNDVTLIALLDMVKPSSHPLDLKRTAFALRLAREYGVYERVLREAMDKRAEWVRTLTLWQSDWKRKVSRRPSRGRHHDSWQIRELYVRIHNGPEEYRR